MSAPRNSWSSFRLIHAICLLFLSSGLSFSQNTRRTYRPVRAEWSAALQRIVMVSSSPNQLNLFDPVAQTSQSVALGAAPVSLSVSPNGLFAAVGHIGSASYVDLTNRSVVKTLTYPASASGNQGGEVVLASAWLYVVPTGYSDILSIPLGSGPTSSVSFNFFAGGRLHPDGKAIYATNDSSLQRIPVSATGTLSQPVALQNATGYSACGGIWFSPDGSRIYNGCGTAARYDADPLLDARYLGKFFNSQSSSGPLIKSFTESVTGRIAVIPQQLSTVPPQPSGVEADNKIALIASSGFQDLGRLAIPTFPVGSRSYLGQGRWVFFNNAGSAVHVVYQAETSSGLLNDFAVQTYDLANPGACTVTFPSQTLTVGSDGALRSVDIQAAADCVYSAASNSEWVQVVGGGFGSGNSTMTVHVRSNPGTEARTATVTLGSQTLQINQAGAPATIPAQQIFSYKLRDADYSKALDRVVLVSAAPNELHLYDPVTRVDQPVSLPYGAVSVNVSPDGLKAAVGHSGYVS